MLVRMPLWTSAVLLVALAGCSRETSVPGNAASHAAAAKPTGGVGVVDLDSVAKQLGRDVEMNDEIQEKLTSLNSKLATFKNSLNRLFEEKQTSFGEEPTEEQQKQLTTMQDRMAAQLLESKRKGENELAVYKQQLIEQFREQAKPVLREVAAARGLSIVVPKNNGLLLSIDPGVEITDEVAKRMLASKPAATKGSPEAKAEPAPRKSRRGESTETSSR